MSPPFLSASAWAPWRFQTPCRSAPQRVCLVVSSPNQHSTKSIHALSPERAGQFLMLLLNDLPRKIGRAT